MSSRLAAQQTDRDLRLPLKLKKAKNRWELLFSAPRRDKIPDSKRCKALLGPTSANFREDTILMRCDWKSRSACFASNPDDTTIYRCVVPEVSECRHAQQAIHKLTVRDLIPLGRTKKEVPSVRSLFLFER